MRSRKKSPLLVLLLLFTFSTTSFTNEIEDLLKHNRADEALVVLKQLTPKPLSSADFYNYSLVYKLKGEPVTALAYADQAVHISPLDSFYRKYLNELSGNTAINSSSTLIERISEAWIFYPSIIIFWGLLLMIFALAIRSKNRTRVIISAILAIFLSFASFLPLTNSPRYFISTATPVYSGPGDSFIKVGDLNLGSSIRYLGPLVSKNLNWVLVRFTNEKKGWIPASSLLLFSDK